MRAWLHIALMACLAAIPSRIANAGAGYLDILVVDLGPATEEARACSAALRRAIAVREATVHRADPREVHERVGDAGAKPLLDWTGADLDRVDDLGGSAIETLVLIDCRPAHHRADVLIVPPSAGVIRLELRLPRYDERVTRWFGERIWRLAWTGYVP